MYAVAQSANVIAFAASTAAAARFSLRAAMGSRPAASTLRQSPASSRALRRLMAGYPPSPMSRRRPRPPFRQAAIRRCRSNDLGLSLTGQNDPSQDLHRAIDLVLTPRGEAKK